MKIYVAEIGFYAWLSFTGLSFQLNFNGHGDTHSRSLYLFEYTNNSVCVFVSLCLSKYSLTQNYNLFLEWKAAKYEVKIGGTSGGRCYEEHIRWGHIKHMTKKHGFLYAYIILLNHFHLRTIFIRRHKNIVRVCWWNHIFNRIPIHNSFWALLLTYLFFFFSLSQ